MGSNSKAASRQVARARRLLARQPAPEWKPDYEPAIKAVRGEAPPTSRCSTLCAVNRLGRAIHTLSLPERGPAMVALFHPRLVDLHEQKILQPVRSVHPLTGHPETAGLDLPPVLGTHRAFQIVDPSYPPPVIRFRDPDGRSTVAPEIFVGDLLLYLRDQMGLYCVNWSVKSDAGDFGAKLAEMPLNGAQNPQYLKASRRNAAEELSYRAADIPTYRIDQKTFDPIFIDNLTDLFCWQAQRSQIKDLPLAELIGLFTLGLTSRLTIPELASRFMLRWRRPANDFRTALGMLIWDRRIRVDLSRRLLLDGPLRPEVRDQLDVYGHLFARLKP